MYTSYKFKKIKRVMIMINSLLIAKKPDLITFNKNLTIQSNIDEIKKSDKNYKLMSFEGAQALRALSLGSISFGSSPVQIQSQIAKKTTKLSNEINDYKIKKVSQFIEEKLKEIVKKDSEREIPVFRKVKEGFIEKLAQKIAKNPDKSVKIAIAGESASGKTTFANHVMEICEGFNKPNLITMVSCDNYYKARKDKIDGEIFLDYLKRTKQNLDCPDAVDLPRFEKDVERLAKGETFKIPRLDFKTSNVIENAEEKKPAKIILTEGLFTLIDDVKDNFDIRIYVHRKPKTIKRHWFERAPQRHNSQEEIDYMWKSASTGGKQFVRPSRKNADIVINRKSAKEDRESVIKEIFKTITTASKLLSFTPAA